MEVKQIVPDETKLFLINRYIDIKYSDLSYFVNPKHRFLVEDIVKLKKFKTVELGETIKLAITLIEQFKVKETEVFKIIKKSDILNYTYNLVKDTPEIKKLIDGAEVIQLVQDPVTGEFKEPTLH